MSNNLFGDSNPFADPAVQRATENAQANQRSLDDYNPFAQSNFQSKPAAIIPTNNTPIPAQTYQPPPAQVKQEPQPPPYTQSSAQQLNLSQIEKQQQELDRRAAELDRREQALSSPTSGGAIENNFPPLPKFCPSPLRPCFYQDINREIPMEFQRWVRLLFYLWLFHTAALGFNIIAALVVFIATDSGATFGFSILFFVLFTPLSYVCWFRPAYKAFKKDSSINFMLFFFVFFCQIIVNVIEAVGFIDSGFCGFIFATKVTKTDTLTAVMVWISTAIFVAIAVASIILLILIHRLYRGTSASFEKAQKEFASSVMSNKNVQNAAATVVTESARAAMSQSTTNNYGSPGRF